MSEENKPRLLCTPWDGTQGGEFTRRFAPDFKGALHGIQDKQATLHEHLMGQDPGSVTNPHPGAIGSDIRAESERLFRLRSRKLFSLIRQHILDETVKQDIDDNANSEGVAAWAIVERYGVPPRTGLTEIDEDLEWTSLRLSDVGIDEKTIINIMATMNKINRERETSRQYTNEQKRKKLLALITFPQDLAAKAREELQRPSYKQGGNPSLQLTVNAFDELWRHAFRSGLIKRQAPPQRSKGGNRVDALHAGMEEPGDHEHVDTGDGADLHSELSESDVFGAFTKTRGVPASLSGQKLCNTCMGWGHDADVCPSDKRPRRPGDCIDGVRYLKLRRPFDRRDGGGGQGRPVNGVDDRLHTKRGRFRKRFTFTDKHAKRSYMVEADGDGNLHALDADVDVTDAHVDIVPPLDSHALTHEPDGCIERDAFGIIPPSLGTYATWTSAEGFDLHSDDAPADDDANTVDATRDPKVAATLDLLHANDLPPLFPPYPPRRFARAVAVHTMRRVQRTTVAILMLLLALVNGAPVNAPVRTFNAYATSNRYCDQALIDSGSTRTASGDRRLFPCNKIKQTRPNMRVRVANGVYLPVQFVGTMVLTLPPGEVREASGALSAAPTTLELPDALYVPGLCATLLSTKAMFREQRIRTYLNDELRLVMPDRRHVRIRETAANYTLVLREPVNAMSLKLDGVEQRRDRAGGGGDEDLIHDRLAHFSIDRINASVGHVHGLNRAPTETKQCRACTVGGATKPPTKRPTQRTYSRYGECIASDLCEMPASSPFGFRYMLTFYDLATKYLEVYYLRTPTAKEVKASFEQFLADNKRFFGDQAITWLTDNGSEFYERNLDKFLREFEIRHRSTVPYNPQTNPAERANKLLLRPCRIMLAAANVGEWLWPWAINQIAFVHNALCTRSATAIAPLSPFELKTGKQPRVDKLRVMFCEALCYLRGEAQEMSKLAPRRVRGIHLGIDQRRGGFFVYLPDVNRLTTIRFDDVEFDERSFPEVNRITGTYVSHTTRYALPSVEQQVDNTQAEPPRLLRTNDLDGADSGRVSDSARGAGDTLQDDQNDGPPSRRLRSSGYHPTTAGNACIAEDAPDGHVPLASIDGSALTLYLNETALVSDVLPEPRSLHEVAGRPDEDEWRQALLDEYRGKVENGTFELVRRPEGRRVCKTKLVFKNKVENGALKKRKVRWVLCGYSQKPGLDFNRTFTATARATSIRIFFATVAYFDLNLRGIDVTRAFTHAELTDAELYCEQMEGFEQYDKQSGEKLVCLLKKALEGGRQCGHLWQAKLTSFLRKYGFEQFYAEPCIFTLRTASGFLILLVWIDDVAVAYNDTTACAAFTSAFGKAFKSTTTDELTRFVGMEIKRDRGARTITLSQKEYIEKMANRFLPTESLRKGVSTPAWFTDAAQRTSTYSNIGLAKEPEANAAAKGKPYLELVASILYAETMTRPDIAYHVGMLCRFMHNPAIECYARAEELLNYLYATRSECIELGGHRVRIPTFKTVRDAGAKEFDLQELERRVTGNCGLMLFSDSSWKVDHTYIAHVGFFLNGPVDWSTRLLKVSASSCHAETAAACMAARRNRYMRALTSHLLNLVGDGLNGGGTLLFVDNSAAVDQAENLSASKKTEHYKRWEYTLREAQCDGEVKTVFVRTIDQVADILTKVLDKTTFLKHARALLQGKA